MPTNTQLLSNITTYMLDLSEPDRYDFAVEAIQKIALIGGSDTWEILQSIADAQYLVIESIVGKKKHK